MWHPLRQQLFWFDIIGKRLMTQGRDGPQSWSFDEHVSTAGWVDRDTLLMASETGLWRFDLRTGQRDLVVALEAENPVTRSNDGRADPWGGFWIGTMGKQAERHAGAIYRLYKGELRRVVSDITISNAICFAPDRSSAYYTDTKTGQVMRQPLQAETGWPEGDAQVFLDFREEGLNPDGAVTDKDGNIWIAQWGASRVAAYSPAGTFLKALPFAARHTSCPGFGGPEFRDLYCTTAREGIDAQTLQAEPENGMTFVADNIAQGRAEYQVIL